eukprot:1145836-Pelagomonas_calceolata.AAC.13
MSNFYAPLQISMLASILVAETQQQHPRWPPLATGSTEAKRQATKGLRGDSHCAQADLRHLQVGISQLDFGNGRHDEAASTRHTVYSAQVKAVIQGANNNEHPVRNFAAIALILLQHGELSVAS